SWGGTGLGGGSAPDVRAVRRGGLPRCRRVIFRVVTVPTAGLGSECARSSASHHLGGRTSTDPYETEGIREAQSRARSTSLQSITKYALGTCPAPAGEASDTSVAPADTRTTLEASPDC